MERKCYGCGFNFETENLEATTCPDCLAVIPVGHKPTIGGVILFCLIHIALISVFGPFIFFLIAPFLGF